MNRFLACFALAISLIASPHAAQAEGPAPSADDLKHGVVTRSPEIKIDKVDHDRIAVHRIDVVDDKGVIRATLAAQDPLPVIGGVQYKRVFPAAGLILFDRDGNERGGFAVADIEGSAVMTAVDHTNGDAIGWRVMPDGAVTFQINERSPVRRDAAHGNVLPGEGTQRIAMSVAADGTPAIALQDKESRPRLRLTLTSEGFGAIEFLDAAGHVIETIAPEAQRHTP